MPPCARTPPYWICHPRLMLPSTRWCWTEYTSQRRAAVSHVHARGCLCSRSCGGRRKRRGASTTLGRVPGRRRHHRAGGAPGGAVAHGDGVSHTPQAECNSIRTCSWTVNESALHAKFPRWALRPQPRPRVCTRGSHTELSRDARRERLRLFQSSMFYVFSYLFICIRTASLPAQSTSRALTRRGGPCGTRSSR